MESFFTKNADWLYKWDDFLKNENRGNHLLYSDWLTSYKSYGFDFEVFIVLNNTNEIIGGFGAVIAKSLIFKFYIVPIGPIFRVGFESEIQDAITHIKIQSTILGCCFVQFKLPIIEEKPNFQYTYSNQNLFNNDLNFQFGNLFKHVYSSNGFNWVSFDGCNSSQDLLNQFSVQVRRNINISLKTNADISFAETLDDCQLAYAIIQKNANENNYSVRLFEDFKRTILSLIQKKLAFMMVVKINNQIKGSAFVVNCGNHYTYITGGTFKEKPDLKMGYLLHWKIIEKSFEMGFSGYNISLGGSKGVVDFKAKFNTEAFLFTDDAQYLILKPIYFKLYLLLKYLLKNNKKSISRILKFLSK
ncbi:MAG: peptidoglycan bridge formation glycyltransferase FemA/FemB family protein [Flavobacterium sp.]|nr:peptidoglycan bridge formation glycyltransferase FemA/FemB family protein [Flavobacterium sp.]